MKIKVVGAGGQQLHDCEDVTITYYTERTVAFQDAYRKWQEQVHKAAKEHKALKDRQERYEIAAKSATHRRDTALAEAERLASGQPFSWLMELIRRLPFVRDRVSELRQEARIHDRDVNMSTDSAAEMSHRAANAERKFNEIREDELTPGIELAMRMRETRSLRKVYLPQDGDAAYIMNDKGDTIDSYRWPIPQAQQAQVGGA